MNIKNDIDNEEYNQKLACKIKRYLDSKTGNAI